MRPIAFTIGDAEIALQRVTGHLALSELFQLTVEGTVDEEVSAATDLLGEPFSLTLEDPFDRSTSQAHAFTGGLAFRFGE